MSNTEPKKRTKIAILGGGVGAITAAFELTDPDNPGNKQENYDVTVYQLGWRLGGKCASGRSVEGDHPRRIEEHGLHLWFGSYDNAFKLIRKCYKELNRPAGAPLAKWEQAFRKRSTTVLMEYVNGKWLGWRHDWKEDDKDPGATIKQSDNNIAKRLQDWVQKNSATKGTYNVLVNFTDRAKGSPASIATRVAYWWIGAFYHAHLRWPWFREVEIRLTDIARIFMLGFWKFVQWRTPHDNRWRRLWIMLHFGYAAFRGGVMEDLVGKGYERLNNQDFRQWLMTYALDDGGLMVNSAWMYGLYDACFAYKRGDNTKAPGDKFPPNASLAAGTALCIGLRQLMVSKGSVCWEMQAGTADTIFAPMYQVLKARGVKFEFFSRVTAIHADKPHGSIDRIDISRQATVIPAQRNAGGYNPLIDVYVDLNRVSPGETPGGSGILPCWPSAPLYDQLVEGARLKAKNVDLEAFCYDWQDVEQSSLKLGEDFDKVVLGISLGALPYICTDLIDKSTKWQAMVRNLQTTRTMGVQLWLQPTLPELGWQSAPSPILGALDAGSLNTWADMKHLLPCEVWASNPAPQSLAYFCGPMRDDQIALTPYGPKEPHTPNDQQIKDQYVITTATDLLNNIVHNLWPQAVDDAGGKTPRQFKWDKLVGIVSPGPTGQARLNTQWVRANIAPSERYVLSVQSDQNFRLPSYSPEEFDNLYLAGDWTDNRMNVGCVEAATMSGMLASFDLSGYPELPDIHGMPQGVAAGVPTFVAGGRPYQVDRPPVPARSPNAKRTGTRSAVKLPPASAAGRPGPNP